MRRLFLVIGVILFTAVSCGVKGPPEPPLPNEANLENRILKDATKDASPTTTPQTQAPNIVAPDTATKAKTKDTEPKKKPK